MKNKTNFLRTLWAGIRFFIFFVWVFINLPIAFINPGGRIGVWQFRILMWVASKICGLRYRVRGKLSKKRPLLLIGNHIGSMEFAAMPAALGINFFGKSEIAKMPLIGFVAKKMGVQFIDRNPRRAMEMVKKIKEFTEHASYPMVIFPEGISTNGSYVHPFKSALFNMVEPQLNGDKNAAQFTIQPFVMYYRDGWGNVLSDQDLAENYAGFAPEKMLHGPVDVPIRGEFEQLFHIMKLGGLTIELDLLPPPPLAGIHDRHELAEMLYKIVNDEYMKFKDIKK